MHDVPYADTAMPVVTMFSYHGGAAVHICGRQVDAPTVHGAVSAGLWGAWRPVGTCQNVDAQGWR